MDFLNGRIRPIYFKYLGAAFGSALITSIYSIVDMAMVGQYHGPDGTAALAVVAPVWNIIYSLGLLMGTGGSVIFSTLKGRGTKTENENEYFTTALIGSVILAVLSWAAVLKWEESLLLFFGADERLLYLVAAGRAHNGDTVLGIRVAEFRCVQRKWLAVGRIKREQGLLYHWTSPRIRARSDPG